MAATPAPEPEPAPLPQPETKPALPATVVLDGSVLRHTAAGWKLEPQGQAAIHQVAEWIRSHGPGTALIVTGFSSSTGTQAQNLAVSRHRAEFIAQALTKEGVPSARITVKGRGAEIAVASNATRAGRLKNERVEVSFQNP
jgi:outer membrane protein OmpA-like peptidoglycan-associated protein